jgi:drug/metabolite transporter (DMT)-like permease
MSELLALLAALANAGNLVTQHVSSTRAPEGTKPWQLVVYLVRQPMWLFGWVALLVGFLLHAVALHVGALSVVQPILVAELVFALVIRRLWFHHRVSGAAWRAAVITCAGLALFIVASESGSGGGMTASLPEWLSASVVLGAIALLMVAAARWGTPTRKAALYGTATGMVWALEAAYIKSMTDTLAQDGFLGMFAHWPVYAVIVGGIVGNVIMQAAVHQGPLHVSSPLMIAADPIFSIVLGFWLFDEQLGHQPFKIALSLVGLVTLAAGIWQMTQHEPTIDVAKTHLG